MRILPFISSLAITAICGCAHNGGQLLDHYFSTISFPNVELSEGERIESVEVITMCARFRSINYIPNDWSAEVISPVSEVSTFKAEAGHGSSWLWSSHDLDGFLTIMVCDPSCFTIKATMIVSAGDHDRTISFAQPELVMKKTTDASRFRSR